MKHEQPGRRNDGGQGGFTLIELVVTILVIAIIAKIAGPAWVDVKAGAGAQAADMTKERLKARWLAAMNDSARKVGDPPTLGRVVGYKTAVPPAPAQTPMLLDYSYSFFWQLGAYSDVQMVILQAANAMSYAGAAASFDSVDQVTCDSSIINGHIPQSAYYTANDIHKKIISTAFMRVSGSESSVPVGSPVPKCRGSIVYWNGASTGPASQSQLEAAGWPHYCIDASHCLYDQETYTYTSLSSNSAIYGRVMDAPANSWRMTCKGYEATYGVPYAIAGAGGAENGKTVGGWNQVIFKNYYEATPFPNQTFNLDGTSPSVGMAVCQRVGGPTPGNPEYLGDPPLALDFSGWCLGSGTSLKLPAYKDEDGTIPTTNYADTVKAIGKPVADPVNCPAS